MKALFLFVPFISFAAFAQVTVNESVNAEFKHKLDGELQEMYRGRFHPSLQAKETKLGFDNTLTLTNPVILRGNKVIPFDDSSTSIEGVCRAFGFDSYLKDSLRTAQLPNIVGHAQVSAEGNYLSVDLSSTIGIGSITCFDEAQYRPLSIARDYRKSIDRSVTLIEPRIIRGNRELPFDDSSTSLDGVCRSFGFRNSVKDSLKTGQVSNIDGHAEVSSNGKYLTADQSSTIAITEITCANDLEVRTVGAAKRMSQNFDRSVTLSEPRLLRGTRELKCDG